MVLTDGEGRNWLVDVASPVDRARVQEALASCSVLSLSAGSALGGSRFEAIGLLAVEQGIVYVSAAHRGTARRAVLGLAGPASLMVAPAADQALEALTDARVRLLAATACRCLFRIPATAEAIVDSLADGLRDSRESLAQLSNPRHSDRVHQKLVQLARLCGTAGDVGLVLDLPLTHELLADMVGSTRETVTRSLTDLGHAGLIQHERGHYLMTADL